MKREFLEAELSKLKVEDTSLVKGAIDSIMAEYGKGVKKLNEDNEKLTTERDTLKTQLIDANKTIEDFKNIDVDAKDKAIQEWKDKCEQITKESEEKISKMTYNNVLKELVSSLSFTSEASKKGFMADLEKKELKLDGDKLLGWNDFVSSYKESDPQAFKVEKEEPKVIASTGGTHEKENSNNSILDLKTALKEQYGK